MNNDDAKVGERESINDKCDVKCDINVWTNIGDRDEKARRGVEGNINVHRLVDHRSSAPSISRRRQIVISSHAHSDIYDALEIDRDPSVPRLLLPN